MKFSSFILFLLSLLFFFFFFSIVAGFRSSDDVELPDPIASRRDVPISAPVVDGSKYPLVPASRPTGRSILSTRQSSNHNTVLIASLDGTIYLVDGNSGKVRWSFSSGPALSSAYRSLLDDGNDEESAYETGEQNGTKPYPEDDYFVECGDDWNLYVHTKQFGKTRLQLTLEEFVNRAPHILEDGRLILGSTTMTVFIVDAKSGRVIHTSRLPDIQSTAGVQSDEPKPVLSTQAIKDWEKYRSADQETFEPLYITRKDYILQSLAPNSSKVSWNTTVAEIGAHYLCRGLGKSLAGIPFTLEDGHDLEYQSDFEMPLQCQIPTIVYRTRDNLLESRLEGQVLPLPPSEYSNSLISDTRDENSCEVYNSCLMEIDDADQQNVASIHKDITWRFTYIFLICIVPLVCYYFGPKVRISVLILAQSFLVVWHHLMRSKHDKSDKQLTQKQHVVSKRRKARRGGNSKNSAVIKRPDKDTSSENEDAETSMLPNTETNDRGSLLNSIKDNKDGKGRQVGKLFVSNTEIAKGSNGTVVFEGTYTETIRGRNGQGVNERPREVAVKRLALSHNDIAFKEIENLMASEMHPNIVRFYGVEQDVDYVYLSLERCNCSLNDLIQLCSETSSGTLLCKVLDSNSISEYNVRLYPIKGIDKDTELWKANGVPSPMLLKVMRDVVSGLAHLHKLGIIHRDLKPQNVLISKEESSFEGSREKSLCAKISDMGISKCLGSDMSSLGHCTVGCGSSGWRAPEQLLNGRQTRAVDLFSLGCVLFYCITGGKHPFGDFFVRDANILKNHFDLFLVEHIPEAVDLFSHLLHPDPEQRPRAKEVLYHPFLWSSQTRLFFLRDVSDRVELEEREYESDLMKALENVAPVALGGKWDQKVEAAFITNIGRYRRYNYESTRDLLRVIRNKLNHYGDLPKDIKELLGPVPEGYYGYFASRFPKLLIEVYKVIYKHCREEDHFYQYFRGDNRKL